MTLTDVANIALEDLGERSIESIDSDDFNAKRIKRRIISAIDDVASMRKWTCLRKTEKLILSSSSDKENRFLLPNGLIEIISTNPPCDWRKEGKELVSTAREIMIFCTVISYDPNKWDVNFKGAVIAKLRADISFMITANAQLSAQAKQLAQVEISRYIGNDIYAERPREIQEGTSWWLDGW